MSDLLIVVCFIVSFDPGLPVHSVMLRAGVRALAPLASQSTVRVVFPVATYMSRFQAGLHTAVSANLPLLNQAAMYQQFNPASKQGMSWCNISEMKCISEDRSFKTGDLSASCNGVVSLMGNVPFPLVIDDASSLDTDVVEWEALNRNARRPKRANHGKRPCSHVRRRSKRVK
jgi:hypothetical protein